MSREAKRLTDLFLRHVAQTSPAPAGIVVDRAEGPYVWDVDGRRYLDLLSGIGVMGFGHGNPEVIEAISRQAPRYLHTLVYGEAVEQPQVELAATLARIAPGDLSVTFFANSGTEAIEGAIKLARKYTGRSRLIAFRGGYHGDSTGALALCDNDEFRRPFEPLLPDVTFLPFGATEALAQIDAEVAAVIVEPIQGEGGVRIPPDDFLPELRRVCDHTGALLIFDEVMTGLGRTGAWFACQHWDVTPDVLVLAKALGGGLPLGAFTSRPEIMRVLVDDPPLSHVTTFGGHPLSCAAGLAALRFSEREGLPHRAAQAGHSWLDRLTPLRDERLVDVRGHGLLIGLEWARPDQCAEFCQRALSRGLIVNWTLHRDTVVRLAPPMILSDRQTDAALTELVEIVGAIPEARGR